MNITKIETNKNKNYYYNTTTIKHKKYSPKKEFQVINVYPDLTFQEFIGFGGAITESTAYSYSLLPDEKKKEFMNDVFINSNYTFCRLPIGSCDFSLKSYAYSKKRDLSDFSIEKDKQYIIPFIKDALKTNPNIRFLASPWSPPRFMKNTKIRCWGGKLLNKYRQTYADYIVKYIKSYEELGINIEYITIQNETNAMTKWESCRFSSEKEVDFLVNYLYPTFQENGIKTKILVYDHNKEKLLQRATEEFSNPKASNAAVGIAFHWYTGSHFENIALCREKFPDKLLIHTEGCCGFNPNDSGANHYAVDIAEDLNSGINGYIDWNILLDCNGGPNHKKNFCNSPIMLNSDNSDYNKTLAYYYIGHFSKVIKPGAVKIAHSKYTPDIKMTAFKNLDGSISVVMLNSVHYNVDFNLCIGDIMFKDTIEGNSMISYLIEGIT